MNTTTTVAPSPRETIERLATPLEVKSLYKNNQAILFVVPHPNDLVLSCSALIAQLSAANAKVYVTFLTSGFDIRSQDEQDFRKKRKLREREALRACLKIGVRRNKIHFMHLGQKNTWYSKPNTEIDIEKHLKKMITRKNVGTVFLPWRRDPDFEHVHTFLIGRRAIETHRTTMIEFPILLWETDKQEYWPIEEEAMIKSVSVGDYYDTKVKAIRAFQSKIKILNPETGSFVLRDHDISNYLKKEEYYFQAHTSDPA